MDEFDKIANEAVNDEFANLTKAAESLTPEQREAYAETFPIRIMFVAGIDRNNTFEFSAN